MKRTVYLAARYSRRAELCRYREQLESLGFLVTSRWLNGNHQISDDGLSAEARREERERFATEDFHDLRSAAICISFTEAPRSSNSRGGRHVEFGIAVAIGSRCMVVGPRENVFHCLPCVEHFGTWDECRGAIEAELLLEREAAA